MSRNQGIPGKASDYTLQTLEKLAASAPAPYQMLQWIGIHTRRARRRRLATQMALLGTGLVVGGGIAALLTPRSGPELQREVGRRLRAAKDSASSGVREVRDGLHSRKSHEPVAAQVG